MFSSPCFPPPHACLVPTLQTKRATKFLYDVWEYVDERVVLVVTHSGFTRSVLLAVGREPYRPQNTELVPVIIKMAEDGPFLGDDVVDQE